MNTRHPANPRRVVRPLFYVAGLALAAALAHADQHDVNVSELPAAPPNTYEESPGIDPGGAAAFASADLRRANFEQTALRSIEQLTPEQREAFLKDLSLSFSVPIFASVTVKNDDPKCFLESADWESCFEGLPPEPQWTATNVPELPMSSFWQLRSLWTKTPVERLDSR